MLPFMMGEKGKIASMIVAKPEVKEVSDNETDYTPGKEAAVSDIANAIEKKDLKLLMSGLEDFISMCMDEYESKPHEENDEGEDEGEIDFSPKSGEWK